MKGREYVLSGELIVVLTLTLVALCGMNCTFAPNRYFRAVKQERPVSLFDRYILSFSGGGHSRYVFIAFNPSFATKHTDTTRLDTIPILKVDSVCFMGSCLSKDFCLHLQTQKEYADASTEGRNTNRYFGSAGDLQYDRGALRPDGCFIDKVIDIPAKCGSHDIRVCAKVRMIDRTTGEVLAEELKEVQFEIVDTKPYLPGPRVKPRLPF